MVLKKIGKNTLCPCGSGQKYKKCCYIYHQGALAKDALSLMKSRYSAYAVGDVNYIIKTTHPSNSDYLEDTKLWKKQIKDFCNSVSFDNLEILEFIDGKNEAFVTFRATLSGKFMVEKSRFLKINSSWLYIEGEFK